MYDDSYPTCAETYATLRVDPGDLDPSVVTERLGIEPSGWQRRGEMMQWDGRPWKVAPLNGWFLCSQGQVDSKDSRRHIDWILDRLASRTAVRTLREAGCRMDLCCFWLSRSGHGGPTISPSQMERLADFRIELWYDIYVKHG